MGLPPLAALASFPCGARVFATYRPQRPYASLVHPPQGTPLQSSFSQLTAPRLSAKDSTYQGSRPSLDITLARPQHEGTQPSLRSVLRLSQPLDGLLRTKARRLVSSRNRAQDPSRSGASPSAQPPSLIGRRCPLAVFPEVARPKGRPRSLPLDFEALLHTEKRLADSVVNLAADRSPLRVSCSSRCSVFSP